MAEKQLAQRLLVLLREIVGKNSREAEAALGWARDNRDWLWPDRAWAASNDGCDDIVWESLPALASGIEVNEPGLAVLESLGVVSDLLGLEQFDRELLTVVAAFERLPRLTNLRARLAQAGCETLGLCGQLAGAPQAAAEARARRSQALALGLISIEREYSGTELQLQWSFGRLLDQGCLDEASIIESLAGIRQSASLTPADFVEHQREFDLLVRLLRNAMESGVQGVNVLIYGPPGTGKTEFARTLAAEIGANLYAVGEADEEGDEPTRRERLNSLNRAQRLLARRRDSLLLFDELEDLFAEASTTANGQRRSGSKIFVNRLLEQVAVPVIWTSNALDAFDPAHLRRLSFVLKLGYPSRNARSRLAARAGEAEGVASAAQGLGPLLASEADSGSVARVALRTAALAGGGADDAEAAARSLLRGIRGGRELGPAIADEPLDLSLYSSGSCIESLVRQLTDERAPVDFSLLLNGPPGTGKTALAADLARRLDRPLEVKRASDLLSKWVGQTEANIADAFADARERGAVLLFDEADSLLLDRSNARTSWEVTQVNELLTWMDGHPLPFIAATNFSGRLDPAAFRRFVFKLELQPLSGELLERAFVRFFDSRPPPSLRRIGGLTPGDFAVVKRQLRFRGASSPTEVAELLRMEAEAKPASASTIGF